MAETPRTMMATVETIIRIGGERFRNVQVIEIPVKFTSPGSYKNDDGEYFE